MTDRNGAEELLTRLRNASVGELVWRAVDVETEAYCIEFTIRDSAFPEKECREWLARKQATYPKLYGNFTIKPWLSLTPIQRLCREAADTIEQLLQRGDT